MIEIFSSGQNDINTILLVLSLPIIVTIVAICKHIIGLKTLNLILVVIVSFLFYEFASSPNTLLLDVPRGIVYGLILIFLVFVSTSAVYAILKPVSLHYYPKIAIVLTIVSSVVIVALLVSEGLGTLSLFRINTLGVLLSILLAERIIQLQARKSFKNTIIITLETVVIALISFLLISIPFVQEQIVNRPYILALLLPINYFLGRFTGLRLREYFRFKDILNNKD